MNDRISKIKYGKNSKDNNLDRGNVCDTVYFRRFKFWSIKRERGYINTNYTN